MVTYPQDKPCRGGYNEYGKKLIFLSVISNSSYYIFYNYNEAKRNDKFFMSKFNLLNRSVFIFSIFIFSLFGFLIYGDSVYAGTLSGASVAPNTAGADDLIEADNAQWKFSMTNETALADYDVVQIVFPNITNGPTFTVSNSVVDVINGTTSITLASTTVGFDSNTRTLGFLVQATSSDITFSITANGINNPLGMLSSLQDLEWIFKTGTPVSTSSPNGFAGPLSATKDTSATTTASLIRGGGPLTSDFNSRITPSSYTEGATNVTYTFAFTASTSIPSGGKIGILFPSEFILTSVATTTADDDVNGGGAGTIRITDLTTKTNMGDNRVVLTTSGGATTHNDLITVAVTGLTNPSVKGVYRPFFVYTATTSDGLLDGLPFGGGEGPMYANTVPPVDTVHIGGTNNLTVSVYKKNASGVNVPLTGSDLTAVMVGVGCPDKQFFVGFRYLDTYASTTFNNLLDCNYKIGIMPAGGNSYGFFDDKLQPGMMDVSAIGGVSKSVDLFFGRPNAVWTGTITGGAPSDTSGAGIMAYNSQYMAFSPIFTTTDYDTEGFNSSGTGYFKLKVATSSSWTLSFDGGVLTDGSGNKYWPPVMPTVYASSTATTSLGSFAYRWANNDLTVTLKKSDTGAAITDMACVGVRMTGGGVFMGNQDQLCEANSGDNYVFKVPVGTLTVEAMKIGVCGAEEYPLAITASSTSKTIYIAAPTTYINILVVDSLGTKYNGAPVFAQSSNGFGQGMTDANGEAVLYVPPGTYRVDGFIPSMGQLTAKTGIVVSSGSYASTTFTIDMSGYKLISGTVTQEGSSPVSGVQIGARGVSGTTGGNGTVTGSDGTYRLYVPAGIYKVGGWSEATGGLQEQDADASSGNVSGLDWSLAAGGILRIIVIGGQNVTPLFGGAFDVSTDKGNGTDTWTASSTFDKYADLRLPQGTYEVHVGSPITGEITCAGGSSVVVGANTTIYCDATAGLTMVILEGNVNEGSTDIADANVWVSRINGPGFFSTLTDSNGDYSIKIPDTYTYKVGVKKLGYITPDTTITMDGATTTNFSLTAVGSTITGIIYGGSSGLANGWVSAKKTVANIWISAPTDASGRYSLDVDADSTWTIYAEGPCYNRSTGLAASAGDSGKNITLSAISGCVANTPQVSGLSPATGGQVSNGDRMTINIPAYALGTGSDSVSVSVKTADMAVSTSNATPLKNSVQIITATSISGSTITTITSLNNSATLTLTYNESDLPPGYDENNLQLAYFDTTTGQWEPVAATVDTTNNTLTAQIDHFTPYGPILPGVPDPPQNLSATAISQTRIDLTWNSVTNASSYNLYRSTTSGSGFALITSPTSASYSDSGLAAGTTYYYKATAVNDNGASAYSSEVNTATDLQAGGGGGGYVSTPAVTPTATTTPTESVPTEETTAPTAKPDGTLIKYASSPNVYIIEGGLKRLIPSAEIFNALEYVWNQITTILDSETYAAGENKTATITAVTRAAGTLIKYASSPNVYIIENGLKRLIPSVQDFESLGYLWSKIITVPDSETYAAGEKKIAVLIVATPKYVFVKFLSLGTKSDDVKQLQIKLKALGFFPSDVDTTGYFGPITKAAVAEFQESHGISSVGYVGPQTRTALNSD